MNNKFKFSVLIAFPIIVIIEYLLSIFCGECFLNLLIIPTMYGGLLTFLGVWWSIEDNKETFNNQKKLDFRPFLQIKYNELPTGIARMNCETRIGEGNNEEIIYLKCATTAPFVWKAYSIDNLEKKRLVHEVTITKDIWSEICVRSNWERIQICGTDCFNNTYCFEVDKTGISVISED